MSSTKERHYWTQLRAALTAGQWASESPAKTPSGYPISWHELFRKFNKHCRGFQDVADVASHTRELANLLLETNTDDEIDKKASLSGYRKLDLDDEVVLRDKDRLKQAATSFDSLNKLQCSNHDTRNLALAYYVYALGKPKDCIAFIDKVPDLLQFQNQVPVVGSVRSASAVLAPPSHTPSLVSSYTGSFTSLVENVVPEVRDGRGWAMVETFRSLCLKGMSHEQLHPLEPEKALAAYSSAIPLFSSLPSEFTPKSSGKLDFTVFHQLQELWRWVERLLWRAVVLSSRTAGLHSKGQPNSQLWQWLDHYSSCSAYWPTDFRTGHRSTVYSLHIRALILKNGGLSHHVTPTSSQATSVTTSPSQSESQHSTLHGWVHSARSVAQDYRAILTASTKFPRAGERNMEVENFVDLCVAIWEAHGAVGEQAGWVIDILWWSISLTFNSSRILRHLTRLLYLAGDLNLAKRTLRLYVQVVGKACEACKEGVSDDKDTDEHWVDTLVFGARMLLKIAGSLPGLEGIEDVKEAGMLFEKARGRFKLEDKPIFLAKVLLSEGIYHGLLAIKSQEPLKRSIELEKAHVVLQESLLLNPTSSGYYHLAISYARRGGPAYDLDKAMECAGQAVEGQSTDVKYWHLLGILLSRAERWPEAIEILERGADLDEDLVDESNTATEMLSGSKDALTVTPDGQTLIVPGLLIVNGVETLSDKILSSDASTVRPPQVKPNVITAAASGDDVPLLLEADAKEVPLAETLLKSKEMDFEDYPPSKAELFACHLQLRMTQVALMEVIEGPEGAEAGWLEVFSWVAERKGPMNSGDQSTHPRQSLDDPHRSVDRLSPIPSVTQAASLQHHDNTHAVEKKIYPDLGVATASRPNGGGGGSDLLVPIPITISPATPEDETGNVLANVIGGGEGDREKEKVKKEKEKEKRHPSDVISKLKRSTSLERGDTPKTKKVQQMLKHQVHKGRAGITAVSRKIGRNGGLRRSTSTPNFHAALRQTSYQASSIHSRQRLSSIMHLHDRTPTDSPPPPPLVPPPTKEDFKLKNDRLAKENRLLSDLWLMSAATFRRLGKIDQAKGAIQEAEVKDQTNPNVWVQLGLYHTALGSYQYAIDTLQKALFICPDDVSATVHLSKLYLDPEVSRKLRVMMPDSSSLLPTTTTTTTACTAAALGVNSVASIDGDENPSKNNPDVDLAAGILAYLSKGKGWDVAEVWYFLAKAYGMQGRRERERETLEHALMLSEKRGIRDIELALGW